MNRQKLAVAGLVGMLWASGASAVEWTRNSWWGHTNGITLEVFLHTEAQQQPTLANRINCQFISTSGPPFRVYYLKESMACTLELTDPEGKAVRRTWRGSRLGSRFDNVELSRKSAAFDKGGSPKGSIVTTNGSAALHLGAATDFFRPGQDAGPYKLRLQVQILREVVQGRGGMLVPIRFPPVELLLYAEPVGDGPPALLRILFGVGAVVLLLGLLAVFTLRRWRERRNRV